MTEAARTRRAEALAARLDHDDRIQLIFQVQEIAGEQCYEQFGVHLEPGATVLDVGANVGVAAVWFAAFRGAGAVHCFEPAPPNVAMLRRNVGGLDACVVHPYALGSGEANAELTYYAGATAMSGFYAEPDRDRATVRTVLANHGVVDEAADRQLEGRYEPQPFPCRIRRLSTVLAEEGIERVDLLKIDVERAERDVLAGIDEADWPRIRQVVAEVHDERGRLAGIGGELTDRGFAVHASQDAVMRGTSVHLLHAARR